MLKERGWTSDLVFASNSKRTKQTLDEMAEVMHELADVDTHYYGSLYTVRTVPQQHGWHLQLAARGAVTICLGRCLRLMARVGAQRAPSLVNGPLHLWQQVA